MLVQDVVRTARVGPTPLIRVRVRRFTASRVPGSRVRILRCSRSHGLAEPVAAVCRYWISLGVPGSMCRVDAFFVGTEMDFDVDQDAIARFRLQ